jgi:hypothetical protein
MNYTPHRAGLDVWLRCCVFHRHIKGILAQLLHDEFGMWPKTKICLSRVQSGVQVTDMISVALLACIVTAGLGLSNLALTSKRLKMVAYPQASGEHDVQ